MNTILLFLALAGTAAGAPRPNLLLILADDLGYCDLGCYGGEIATPNLDKLAAGGVRFTQVYNCARCCPSRASLLTGQYPHAVNFAGMTGSLPPNCLTLPEVLRAAGYRTYMAGKWHLGRPGPIARGFDEYFGMLGGFGSHWNEKLFTRLPDKRPTRTYPADGFYSSDAITDYALDFLADARKTPKPFFLYLAYTAPHFPLHAPKDDIARYADVYAKGWDAIRQERYARMKKLGLLDDGWPLSPRSGIPANRFADQTGWSGKENPAWESIASDRRADLTRRMAVFAAMVDRMDRNVGRVVDDLTASGQLDNTLIFFLSDNGACAEWDPWGFDHNTGPENQLHTGEALAAMGGPGTYHSYGSGWANACNTPWRLYKHYGHEGGVSTPLIVHWPAGCARRGAIDNTLGHIFDLLPTCAEAAKAAYPKKVEGRDILPAEGRSLLPALAGQATPERALFFEHEGNRGVRQGAWKLVSLDGKPWELYNIQSDRSELRDLASQQPERVNEMAAAWNAWAQRCGVVPEKGSPKRE